MLTHYAVSLTLDVAPVSVPIARILPAVKDPGPC
jgi:hypothetical protein